jgi:CheY-like chemotaxis protein
MLPPEATAELWAEAAVRCVLVPHDHQIEVELRNADGSAFLRKVAPTRQAALNEAEYLRLLLHAAGRRGPGGGLKPFTLVIEDSRDNRDVLSEALRTSGMRALGCRTGAEGLCRARELTPDLVVLDHELPDLSGSEVCRRLREDPLTAATPVIVMTAAPDALRSEGCAPDAVLTRPCQIDTLIAAAWLFVRHLASTAGAGS